MVSHPIFDRLYGRPRIEMHGEPAAVAESAP
jgi:hypothetical protein